MRQNCFFLMLATVLLFSLSSRSLRAQSETSKLELGAQFAAIWLLSNPALDTTSLSSFESTSAGFGGRISYYLTDNIALEGEINFFPKDNITYVTRAVVPRDLTLVYKRHRTEGLFGVKAGVRTGKAGIFGKIRPGFTHLRDTGLICVGTPCATILLARPDYETEFALDLGGVLEFYPSRHSVVRFDLGDTLIRHRSLLAPQCVHCTSHNFQFNIGMGIRF